MAHYAKRSTPNSTNSSPSPVQAMAQTATMVFLGISLVDLFLDRLKISSLRYRKLKTLGHDMTTWVDNEQIVAETMQSPVGAPSILTYVAKVRCGDWIELRGCFPRNIELFKQRLGGLCKAQFYHYISNESALSS